MSDIPQTITDEQVAAYLREQPDFFSRHLDLLEIMHIPHPSGDAISLISKQLELFRIKHQEQEKQLVTLIDIARDNDASFNRMHELTLSLLEANTLQTAIANLSVVLTECFHTDFVVVKIIGNYPLFQDDSIFVQPDDAGLQHFSNELSRNQLTCGRPSLTQARFLFGDAALQVRSCAIVPMLFTELEGLLVIGSQDENRFQEGMGGLFLKQMSEIIGTRLISLLQEQQ